jgi:hypothetical protein
MIQHRNDARNAGRKAFRVSLNLDSRKKNKDRYATVCFTGKNRPPEP